MSEATAGFVGALLGAAVALVTAIITNSVSVFNENRKAKAASNAAHVGALRGSVAAVFSYFLLFSTL